MVTVSHLIPIARQFLQEVASEAMAGHPLIVIREDRPRGFEATVYDPVICLILQGAKETGSAGAQLPLTPGDMLLVTHDLPVTARITSATPEAPYLAVVVRLDSALLRGLAGEIGLTPADRAATSTSAIGKFPADPALVDVLGRFLRLRPGTAEERVLRAPLMREMHFRLLDGPGGAALHGLLHAGSHASRVARAIAVIRRNYSTRLALSDLAGIAAMGQSTFHQHFRNITGTSPLQYQKDIRLTEARKLIVQDGQSVSTAAFAVGYESAAQFSREYARKFGIPPSLDRQTTAA